MDKYDTTSRKSFAGKGIFPAKYAFTLLIPIRNIFLSPKQLIQRLNLMEHFNVLEIGPGPGYFSPPLAKILQKGTLYLLDIQQDMLDIAKKRLEKQKIRNVEYILCDGKTLDFENEYFERVLMVTVLGEVENKIEYLREIHRILKNNGILSVSELAGDPDKLSVEELKNLVCSQGYEVDQFFGNRRNYTQNFRKI